MKGKKFSIFMVGVVAAIVVCVGSAAVQAEVTFEWVTVGNPGNAEDPLNSPGGPCEPDDCVPGIGTVPYAYRIAKYEVTNDQYAEFLNAVAGDDTNGLYNANMGSDPRGGITRSGSSGSFTYAVKASMGNKPVNYVSFFDAMRFVNWLHNGQPSGAQDASTTEDGVYGLSATRAADAQFFIPTENEWYKAAYHQPSADGGDSDDYWLYPTASNSIPTVATARATGDISNPGANVVNYDYGADWNGLNGNVTTVGSAGPLSESFYGTSDQGGNVFEWNETVVFDTSRVLRAGSFGASGAFLWSSGPSFFRPAGEGSDVGFRVASPVPESQPVTFEWATVGNPGNAEDPLNSADIPGIGSVAYAYRIAKHEVTNDQYVQFLNAVAATDTNGLYNANMGSDPRGGITQSGSSGSFTYAVKTNMGNKPVNFVSFFDAMRFVNWLHNGQPSGAQDASTTEDGVYTISDGVSEARAADTQYFIPTENEWYKAAYHQPSGQGGDSDGYWLFPTASNDVPTVAMASTTGDISNPGANVINYLLGADWNGQNGNVTTVGSVGPLSESFYGTSDQGGNVWEWNETVVSGSFRVLRGGSWGSIEDGLQSSTQASGEPVFDTGAGVGFRVASPVLLCGPADLDGDGDVDLIDFGLFQNELTGPGPQ